MTLNVIFFSDESMHKIFLNYGKYDFIQKIPQFIYTTIVSQLIETFLCYLSLTDKHIYNIKKTKKSRRYEQKYELLKNLKCIKIKLIFFFFLLFYCLQYIGI